MCDNFDGLTLTLSQTYNSPKYDINIYVGIIEYYIMLQVKREIKTNFIYMKKKFKKYIK